MIARHGKAKAVLQDITTYAQIQGWPALLTMLAQSTKSLQEGRTKSARKAFADVCKHVKSQSE